MTSITQGSAQLDAHGGEAHGVSDDEPESPHADSRATSTSEGGPALVNTLDHHAATLSSA